MRLRTSLKKIGPLGTALTLGQLALVLHRHWLTIPSEQRTRLADLLRASKGRPSNLSGSERRELRALVRQLDLARLLRNGALGAAMFRRQIRS
jgi:hypothetical protein